MIFAGDLSLQGADEELEQAQETLDDLVERFRSFGSDPCVLAVPGNHDLARARGAPAAYSALRRYHEDPGVRAELWNDPEAPSRRLVDRALDPFNRRWSGRSGSLRLTRFRHGLLPGDFTVTLEKEGIRFGVAGLCSTFLQVTDDDYEGRLAITPRQLTVASGGDALAWIAQHDAAILVTHHSASWLAPENQRWYEADINPAGRFSAHLTAHLHEAAPLVEAGERVQLRCPSFFGLAAWEGRHGQSGVRRFGYSAARLSFEDGETRLSVYPRVASKNGIRPAFALADLDPTGCVTLPAPRFPRLADSAPAFRVERGALRDTLLSIYPTSRDSSRLDFEIGLRSRDVVPGGAAADLWHVLVTEAEIDGALDRLVQLARSEHPANLVLEEAWNAYQRAVRAPAEIPMVRRGSAEEKLADELYETLAQAEPAVFGAVLNALSIDDDTPESRPPQATRAIAAVRQMEREGLPGLQRLDAAIQHVSGTTTPPEPEESGGSSGYGWLAALGIAGLSAGKAPAARSRADAATPAQVVTRLRRAHPAAEERKIDVGELVGERARKRHWIVRIHAHQHRSALGIGHVRQGLKAKHRVLLEREIVGDEQVAGRVRLDGDLAFSQLAAQPALGRAQHDGLRLLGHDLDGSLAPVERRRIGEITIEELRRRALEGPLADERVPDSLEHPGLVAEGARGHQIVEIEAITAVVDHPRDIHRLGAHILETPGVRRDLAPPIALQLPQQVVEPRFGGLHVGHVDPTEHEEQLGVVVERGLDGRRLPHSLVEPEAESTPEGQMTRIGVEALLAARERVLPLLDEVKDQPDLRPPARRQGLESPRLSGEPANLVSNSGPRRVRRGARLERAEVEIPGLELESAGVREIGEGAAQGRDPRVMAGEPVESRSARLLDEEGVSRATNALVLPER